MTAPLTDRVTSRLTEFGLTAAAREWVPRFTQAHQGDALPVVLELLDLEAEERRQRRIARYRQAARLPPGKTFQTLDEGRLPLPLVQQLHQLATGTCLETATAAPRTDRAAPRCLVRAVRRATRLNQQSRRGGRPRPYRTGRHNCRYAANLIDVEQPPVSKLAPEGPPDLFSASETGFR